jgi:ABC-type glycerol-3-phosphate transport system permease component
MDNRQIFNGTVLAWPWRLENYPEAWVATKIGALYWNSVYISTVSTILTVVISALAGYGLGRLEFPGKPYVFALILIGLTIPLQIALIPLFVNLRALGLMNTPLALIGPYTAFGLAFGTYIMKGFFEELPRELEEAARIDGASFFTTFSRVMLPLATPALAAVAILQFQGTWNGFFWPVVFLRDASHYTLPIGLTWFRLSGGFGTNWPPLMAVVVIATIPILVLYVFFQRYFVEGIAASGVKG